MNSFRILFGGAALALLLSCATNPVTGKKELHLISEQQEIQTGAESYLPSRQSQGGDYVVDPVLIAYVRAVGERLAKVSDRPELPYEFNVLNNSVPNAWALPGGKIAVNRGLLYELHNEAELAAVLGHEITHAAARHGAQAMERGLLLQAGMVGLGAAVGDNERGNLLVGAGALGAQLIGKKYGREAELEADHYGMTYMARAGYDVHAAITLQETFVKLFNGGTSNWLDGLFATHPPSPERVEKNYATAQQLPSSGNLGAAEWHNATEGLMKSRDAYAKLDAGRKALEERNAAHALTLADEALRIEPREALLHGLRADALSQEKRYPEAVAAYDKAIAANAAYFQFYLQRGLAKSQLNDPNARADLEKSLALLPTAPAHFALGEMARKRGERDLAKQHYMAAAQSDSELGQRAAVEAARLDIGEHPDKYLATGVERNAQGYIVVVTQNRSPVKVRNIKVALALFDRSGQMVQQDSVSVPGVLEPRQTVNLLTRIGPLANEADIQRVRVKLFSAELAE